MYKILVFSWNTESVSIGETNCQEISDYNRSSYSEFIPKLTTWQYNCFKPDFFNPLSEFIKLNTPDVIIIGFQEDRYPGSYFHSHFLIEEMPKIGYSLLKRNKMMGVGVTTYKGILQGDLFERGLRMSIYCKHELLNDIEKAEINLYNKGQNEYVCSNMITRGKGGISADLILPGFNKITIICAHLPFDSNSLIMERKYKNKMIRQNALSYNNICFNNIFENLVLFQDKKPNNIIYFGDFNYRVSDIRSAEEVAKEFNKHETDIEYLSNMYLNNDELLYQMKKDNIYTFLEGIDNSGPLFLPTCKMIKDQNRDWETGKENQRIPSWCDRILYQNFDDTTVIKCIYYNRFDEGETMKKSDHSAVIGLYQIEKCY